MPIFTPPDLEDFFPPVIWFEGTAFEINRLTLVRIVAALALMLVMVCAAKKAKVVPGRFQGAIEWVLNFVRNSIVDDILGKEKGRQYFPLIATIFLTVLAFNITGIVPFLDLPGTSTMGMPLVLALWAYVSYLWAGLREKGVKGFLKDSMFPPGVPKALYILLAPLEGLQVFVIRPATLAIRLLANMIAGHLLIALCFVATSYFLFDSSGPMQVLGAGTFVASAAFFVFEAFVAVLQAYVFAILTASYISLAVEKEE